jgi:hypothetical protein
MVGRSNETQDLDIRDQRAFHKRLLIIGFQAKGQFFRQRGADVLPTGSTFLMALTSSSGTFSLVI